MILLIMNHDDPDNHDEGSRECKMCLNMLEKPVSALHCKIFNIYKTIDTSLKQACFI